MKIVTAALYRQILFERFDVISVIPQFFGRLHIKGRVGRLFGEIIRFTNSYEMLE